MKTAVERVVLRCPVCYSYPWPENLSNELLDSWRCAKCKASGRVVDDPIVELQKLVYGPKQQLTG